MMVVEVWLVALHMIDGRTVYVSPRQVTQLIQPREPGERTLSTQGVECVVKLTDGSFVSVAETCREVEEAIRR